jgi:ribose 5-phosphate isomerase B
VKRLAIASDHGGFTLKRALVSALLAAGYDVSDHGPPAEVSVDYPDMAEPVARAVAGGQADLGVLVCGSGIGVSIAANKVAGIRAAVVQDVAHARLAREHNDANVLCLGGRFTSDEEGLAIVSAWLDATYQGGRHDARLAKIAAIERRSAPG